MAFMSEDQIWATIPEDGESSPVEVTAGDVIAGQFDPWVGVGGYVALVSRKCYTSLTPAATLQG